MTREAKIGLLVALAFLLVIGILLSDHVTTATREPGAPLASAEQSIRGSITAPGAVGSNQPPLLPQPQQPERQGSPYVYDPSAETLPGQVNVRVGRPERGNTGVAPGAVGEAGVAGAPNDWNNSQLPIVGQLAGQVDAQANTRTSEGAGNQVTIGPETLGGTALAQAAIEGGEPLEGMGASEPQSVEDIVAAAQGTAPQAREEDQGLAGVIKYAAQPGDSLSKMTAKFLGRDTGENREVLLELNPKLRENPDLIVVGREYLVPGDAQAARTMQQPEARRQTQREAGAQAGASKVRHYTVQKGDTLWAIAENQLGDAGRRKEILGLNRDILSDPDSLQVGMKLKLPVN